MSELKNKIESLLFISHKPLAVSELSKLIGATKEEVESTVQELMVDYLEKGGGICINNIGDKYQMATSDQNAELIGKFLNTEMTGELSRPSLETLTIIAYRGPISKVELELIRGVNCSLILRNLLMRGLVEAKEDKERGISTYQITFDFLKYLGINATAELPDFDRLNRSNNLEKLLQGLVTDKIKDDLSELVVDNEIINK